jgi:hypothetical protein
MNDPLILTCTVVSSRQRRRAAQPRRGGPPAPVPMPAATGAPRLARLMALALHLDGLVQTGAVSDYAALARLGHVSRARVTQILNLVNLAPDLQEELLFLDEEQVAARCLLLRTLQPLTALLAWSQQRRAWRKLRG